jgi:hypothetical protein
MAHDRRSGRWLAAVGLGFAALLLIVAEIASIDLVANLQNPVQACQKALPRKPHLVVGNAGLHWPPPLAHCDATYANTKRGARVFQIRAVTATNLLVVAVLDAALIAVVAYLVFRYVRSRRRRGARNPSGLEHDLAHDPAV